MFGRLICVIALAACMLAHDLPKFKQASRGIRFVYGAMIIVVIYLSVQFIASINGPNLDTLFQVFTGPGKQLLKWLNPAAFPE